MKVITTPDGSLAMKLGMEDLRTIKQATDGTAMTPREMVEQLAAEWTGLLPQSAEVLAIAYIHEHKQ